MRIQDFFQERYIMGDDVVRFMNVLKLFDQLYGKENCWCTRKINNPEHLQGFVLSHPNRPIYKRTDARVLVLGVVGKYPDPNKPYIVRYSTCLSQHCINPNHYFYGTKKDVAVQRNIRNGTQKVDQALIETLRSRRAQKCSYAALARQYNLPYHTVRRACLNELPQ